jgi:hypothetical protein
VRSFGVKGAIRLAASSLQREQSSGSDWAVMFPLVRSDCMNYRPQTMYAFGQDTGDRV